MGCRLQRRPNRDLAYTAYGFASISQHASIVGFAGQWLEAVSGLYPLGNGRRMYSPSISRFISPDGLSPFGRGGINAYAYCSGDPVNYADPSGQNRYGPLAQARKNRHDMDGLALSAAKLSKRIRPQLEHFRQAARKMHEGNASSVVVAHLYKRYDPHYSYNRWDLKYSFANDGFTADYVFGNPIFSLPAGKYAVSGNVYILGAQNYQPAWGGKGYRSYEVGIADIAHIDLPAVQHDRAQLAQSAWPEVTEAMWNVRFQREIDRFDKMLKGASPATPPSPPPRRR
ncbi:RHS repeat-associated core domain-containing protein [Pseudomonas sp. JR33AA]|uniref:RHS repeat-associated core domain-containing protein n=1 Tax=Pseudomonas sp. JR33AA TaxID=2899113 RepID=UPI001F23AC31|nr:RHS repeat-associated core domain-containing protein [Pseudomonas sp. JR33AA]MCE5976526.1 RHS repeat-associated core domain-containing protein [Pseudomonas sp. JR33AA]